MSYPFPEKRLTPEHAVSHCPWLASEHRYAEPVDVDVGGETDDTEGEEYSEFEDNPGLRFGSSFASLLLDVLVEVDAAALLAARLLVWRPLCHLTGTRTGETVQSALVGGGRVCRRCAGD